MDKMTEHKRFREYDNDCFSTDTVVDLLNKLADENKTFREALQELKEIGDYQSGRINELNDENEQLKTKNNAYIQDIEVYKEENTHLKLENEELKDFAQHNYSETKKIINNLQKENEQLKKQLESEHTMLDNAILLERTRMGQNSLKQYKEAIQ